MVAGRYLSYDRRRRIRMLSILRNKTGPPSPGRSTRDPERVYAEQMVRNLLQTNPCFWEVRPTASSIVFTGFMEVDMELTDDVGSGTEVRDVKARVQLHSALGLSLINEVTAVVPYDIDKASIQASIAYHIIVSEEAIMQVLTSLFASQKNPEEARQRALLLLVSFRWNHREFQSQIHYGNGRKT